MENNFRIPFSYPKKLEPLFTTNKMFNLAYGGRGSGKTDCMGQVSIAHSFLGSGKLIITRFTEKSIDSSTKSTIEKWIRILKLNDFFNIKNSYIENKYTDSVFLFSGLSKRTMDNIASIDDCYFAWIEEGHNIPKEAWQRFYPSIRGKYNDGSNAKIFITFNPHFETDTFWEFFILNKQRDDTLLIEINHQDNPWFKESSLYPQYQNDLKYMPKSYVNHIWNGKLKHYNEEPVIDISKIGRFSYEKIKEYNYQQVIISMDTAFSVKESADYSVIGIFAMINENEIHLIRILRGRWEFSQLIENLIYAYEFCSREVRTPNKIIIENKASGQSLIQELERKTTLPIIKVNPVTDKYSRVCEVLPIIHSGALKIPMEADALHNWVNAYLLELELFRADMKHEHDDQVDITTQAIMELVKKSLNFDTLSRVFSNFKRF